MMRDAAQTTRYHHNSFSKTRSHARKNKKFKTVLKESWWTVWIDDESAASVNKILIEVFDSMVSKVNLSASQLQLRSYETSSAQQRAALNFIPPNQIKNGSRMSFSVCNNNFSFPTNQDRTNLSNFESKTGGRNVIGQRNSGIKYACFRHNFMHFLEVRTCLFACGWGSRRRFFDILYMLDKYQTEEGNCRLCFVCYLWIRRPVSPLFALENRGQVEGLLALECVRYKSGPRSPYKQCTKVDCYGPISDWVA